MFVDPYLAKNSNPVALAQAIDMYAAAKPEPTMGERIFNVSNNDDINYGLPKSVDLEKIAGRTGLRMLPSGKFVKEVDDTDAKILRGPAARYASLRDANKVYKGYNDLSDSELKDLGAERTTLGNVLKHDALFSAYPDLKKAKVVLINNSDDVNVGGLYSPRNDTILLLNSDKRRPSLLHEIQHKIDVSNNLYKTNLTEGKFTTLYNKPSDKYLNDSEEMAAFDTENRLGLNFNARRVTPTALETWLKTPEKDRPRIHFNY